MRLIDAEGSELQAQLKFIREAEYQIYGRGSWGFTAKCEHAIEDAPTIQPEIVRCKDCKYASGNSRICLKLGHSPIGELDFCSYAERREVNHESN